jgi:hypothetical protein
MEKVWILVTYLFLFYYCFFAMLCSALYTSKQLVWFPVPIGGRGGDFLQEDLKEKKLFLPKKIKFDE